MEDSTNNEALTIADAVLVKTKNNQGTGEITRARARNGKFVATATVSAQADAKASQVFMAATDPNTGMSRKNSLRHALYEAALNPTEKSLGACVKTAEFFESEAGHTKIKNTLLSDESHVHQPVRVVIVQCPELMNKEVIDGDNPKPTSTQPSWAATEPAKPPVLDAEFVTNPRGPKR